MSDTGCGIDIEKKKNMFELFKNVKFENQVNKHGIGLGLTICKKAIESLKGHIEFCS